MTGNPARHFTGTGHHIDVNGLRADFPILHQEVHGKPLVYFDNAATTQKPRQVIETVDRYYREDNANIHRGVHTLSERATASFENARSKIQQFINAASRKEIIFTRGTTESINLVAQSFGRSRFKPGDEIIISEMEHHSNIVPWQMLCEQTGAELKVIPITDDGELCLDDYAKLLGAKTRLVALAHISNALGTINPVKEIIDMAHAHNSVILIDGAQAVAHTPVDVQALGCDFYVFSGHKLFGPTGTGVLYGRETLLEQMPPWQGGGDMIKAVTLQKTVFNDLPYKFEAGTPHIAGVIGLGEAIDYVTRVGLERISAHEDDLVHYATGAVTGIKGLRMIGTARHKSGILSFTLEGVHPHDAGTILDHQGIAVRTGHHCAMPVMDHFKIPATTRASFAFYNTREEIDRLVQGLERCREIFA
jgi:cysteine desulfurase/selenocysteine lyase